MLHAIVMAGGSGTRFWPASRAALPKQLLPLAGVTTLLEDTVERLDGLVSPDRVMVVTAGRLLDTVRRQLPQRGQMGRCSRLLHAARCCQEQGRLLLIGAVAAGWRQGEGGRRWPSGTGVDGDVRLAVQIPALHSQDMADQAGRAGHIES